LLSCHHTAGGGFKPPRDFYTKVRFLHFSPRLAAGAVD
jgi:hypothetical protein